MNTTQHQPHHFSDLGICLNRDCAACTGDPSEKASCPYPRSIQSQESRLQEARDAAENPIHVLLYERSTPVVSVIHLQVALASLEHLEASQHKARARDVAALVSWLRAYQCTADGHHPVWCEACSRREDIADAIEAGDWHDGVLPPDPRDEEIARLRADLNDAIAERDHAVLCYRVAVRPDIAGPAMLDEDLPDGPTEEMRVRSLVTRG